MIDYAVISGCLSLCGWLYLTLFHGLFWRIRIASPTPEPSAWPRVSIVVPARNEAHILPRTLPALLAQDYPGPWTIILVDDHSTDGMAKVAGDIAVRENRQDRLRIVSAPDLASGWSGKVAAMQTGYNASDADYLLFTDADIEHSSSSLRHLVARAAHRKLDLTSLMARLHCRTRAERFLIPPYVFFFAMLYPFTRVNKPKNRLAAAAGGVMLVRHEMLKKIDGFEKIKGEIIDDCSLAKVVKNNGGRIELTHARDVRSLRVYHHVSDVWKLVSRTAFTQLHYSTALLIATTLGMAVLFLIPPLLLFSSNVLTLIAGLLTLAIMILTYISVMRYYGLYFIWALTLPLAALIYMLATIDSARLYWQGRGGEWKGRAQA